MLDRVLYQGLQQQRWQQHAADVGRNIPIEAERVTVARLEDLRVTLGSEWQSAAPNSRYLLRVLASGGLRGPLAGLLLHEPGQLLAGEESPDG